MISEVECLDVLDKFFLYCPYEMWKKWCSLIDDAEGFDDLKKVCKKKGFDNIIRDAIIIIIDYRESKGE